MVVMLRAVPEPLATVVREWGRIGVLGFGGPPVHVALLRELCDAGRTVRAQGCSSSAVE